MKEVAFPHVVWRLFLEDGSCEPVEWAAEWHSACVSEWEERRRGNIIGLVDIPTSLVETKLSSRPYQ